MVKIMELMVIMIRINDGNKNDNIECDRREMKTNNSNNNYNNNSDNFK
jgi:hypothetical protein